MPIKIKDAGTLAAKFASRASNAVPEYKAGVQDPKRSQSASAIAAVSVWQAAVQSPAAATRFTSHLRAAGDAAWSAGALGKGANRYPEGVRAAQTKWQTMVSPFLAAIASTDLPPKGLRGSSANYDRVRAIGDKLHALKVGAAGG